MHYKIENIVIKKVCIQVHWWKWYQTMNFPCTVTIVTVLSGTISTFISNYRETVLQTVSNFLRKTHPRNNKPQVYFLFKFQTFRTCVFSQEMIHLFHYFSYTSYMQADVLCNSVEQNSSRKLVLENQRDI